MNFMLNLDLWLYHACINLVNSADFIMHERRFFWSRFMQLHWYCPQSRKSALSESHLICGFAFWVTWTTMWKASRVIDLRDDPSVKFEKKVNYREWQVREHSANLFSSLWYGTHLVFSNDSHNLSSAGPRWAFSMDKMNLTPRQHKPINR